MGKSLPMIFGLLANKSTETYTRMFGLIKEKINKPPETFGIDFEQASVQAFKKILKTLNSTVAFFTLLKLYLKILSLKCPNGKTNGKSWPAEKHFDQYKH